MAATGAGSLAANSATVSVAMGSLAAVVVAVVAVAALASGTCEGCAFCVGSISGFASTVVCAGFSAGAAIAGGGSVAVRERTTGWLDAVALSLVAVFAGLAALALLVVFVVRGALEANELVVAEPKSGSPSGGALRVAEAGAIELLLGSGAIDGVLFFTTAAGGGTEPLATGRAPALSGDNGGAGLLVVAGGGTRTDGIAPPGGGTDTRCVG